MLHRPGWSGLKEHSGRFMQMCRTIVVLHRVVLWTFNSLDASRASCQRRSVSLACTQILN
ncbi:hypothetical protein E2C01_081565 [Portunus trituberculatus]|uniref:Uncharacterized protein n=1 Tax=Portunus trituberculatus TaxID=210409 RepID=A0A5B7IWY8_PORTR|nr:hypothetical protein [Portunus trituberculatus]